MICDIKTFLNYEIRSSLIAPLVGFKWGQRLMGKYFAWKVSIKYKRYITSKKIHDELVHVVETKE